MHARRWHWFALLVMVFGVPALACGGRVLGDGTPAPGSASSTSTPTGSAAAPGSAFSTGGSAPTASVTPTGSGSAGGSFGSYPCTAYTAWYYSCPPTDGASGCKYAVPMNGDPNDGWIDSTTQSQAPGCQLDIVAPTSVGGKTCARLTLCACDVTGTWVPEQGSDYCPNN